MLVTDITCPFGAGSTPVAAAAVTQRPLRRWALPMASIRRVLTIHPETSMDLQLALLDAVEEVLLDRGASRVWIDASAKPDLAVVAEFSEGQFAGD